MIAAWLHDIASVTDYSLYENHHIYSAEIANELLSGLSYDKEKIVLVQECTRKHRGSVNSEKTVKKSYVLRMQMHFILWRFSLRAPHKKDGQEYLPAYRKELPDQQTISPVLHQKDIQIADMR